MVRNRAGTAGVLGMSAIVQRFAWSVVVLAGASLLTFGLAFVVPSDPARALAGPKADAVTVASIRRDLGLDQPLWVQYGRYVGRVAVGDLGRSYVTGQPVRTALMERLPATAYLATVSFGLAVAVGLAVGYLSAVHAGTGADVAVLVGSLVALSMPVFWIGMLLLDVVAYRWRLLPLGGFGGRHVVLPACTLAVGLAGYYARLLHTNLRGVLAEDYVRTARAKGLGPFRVHAKHALRNALIPLVTVLGLDLAGLLSGVVLTETVFNWPGLGRLAVEAVFNQDIPMVMGTVLFGAMLVVAANFLVDVLYVAIDPRIRRDGG